VSRLLCETTAATGACWSTEVAECWHKGKTPIGEGQDGQPRSRLEI
jgi:hypothetical protein